MFIPLYVKEVHRLRNRHQNISDGPKSGIRQPAAQLKRFESSYRYSLCMFRSLYLKQQIFSFIVFSVTVASGGLLLYLFAYTIKAADDQQPLSFRYEIYLSLKWSWPRSTTRRCALQFIEDIPLLHPAGLAWLVEPIAHPKRHPDQSATETDQTTLRSNAASHACPSPYCRYDGTQRDVRV